MVIRKGCLMEVSIKCYREVTSELLDAIVDLEIGIFEAPYSREKIDREATTKHNLIALIAEVDGQACGFKVGYEQTSRLFYSWIGGVLPNFRGHGIARKLMVEQHKLGKEMGYKFVRTNTENKFQGMLILNLKTGFDIVGVQRGYDQSKTVIMLEKCLCG